MSGFPKRKESDCDSFDTGHSSTSISAAMGLVNARDLLGEKHHVVAVIGDGALTGGMAYEALNNAGNEKGNFIVVLNDNKMSISQNVGAMARALTKMRNKKKYHNFKFAFRRLLLKIPAVGKPLYRAFDAIKDAVKAIVYKKNINKKQLFNTY